MSNQVQITTVTSAMFGENCFILHLVGRCDCLVVDPGLEPGKIVAQIDRLKLTPAVILNTHGHCDHIAGNATLKRRWPNAPIVIGELDAVKLVDAWQNLSAMFGVEITSPPANRTVVDGDQIEYAGFHLRVRDLPGHSIGHVVFIWDEGQPPLVLGGDVLMAGSVGRTDFPDGSFDQLASGIREKLFTLSDETVVLPGHGPPTTIGEEKRTNPFVGDEAVA